MDADTSLLVQGQPGSWSISASTTSILEGDGTVTFTITRPDASVSQTVYISTTINNGSANDGDYGYYLDDPLVFAAGVLSLTVTINITDDSTPEGLETFGLIVQSEPGQAVGEYLTSATFTITDDDSDQLATTFTIGDDWVSIVPVAGVTSYDGLAGTDTAVVDFSGYGADITAELWLDYFRVSTSDSGRAGYAEVRLVGIESYHLIGGSGNDILTGSSSNDFLIGNDGNDWLWAGDGNDTLLGGAGDDTIYADGAGYNILFGGAGNDDITSLDTLGDVIDGGAGIDTLSLFRSNLTAAQGIIFDNSNGGASFALTDGTTVTGIERLLELTTGSGDDKLTLILNDDTTVSGGDYFWSANGGADTAVINFSRFSEAISATWYSSAGGYQQVLTTSGSHIVRLYDVEHYHIIGGSGNDSIHGREGDDILIGNSGDDTLNGAAGNDALSGGAGNDTLTGGAGINVLNGGSGDDTIYSSISAVDAIDGGAGIDTLELRRSNLTDAQDIIFDNRSGSATFTLTDGTTVTGIERVASLETGSGDDKFSLVLNADAAVSGGVYKWYASTGTDTAVVDFSGFAENIVTQWNNTYHYQQYWTANGSHIARLYDVEHYHIIGGSGNDSLTGREGDDILIGNSGDDTLNGAAGNDALSGGAGNDTLTGGDGADILRGEGGSNTLNGDNGDDILYGGGLVDILNGGSGDDLLIGSGGADVLDGGGDGINGDTASYSNSNAAVTVNLSTGTGIGGHAQGDTLIRIERLFGSQYGDTLIGDGLDNVLTGWNGDDTLVGGGGADLLSGGNGNDTADYSSAGSGVSVHIANVATGALGDAAGDTFYNIENLTGSNFSDTLTGTGLANIIIGNAGDDIIYASNGNDTIYGGTGNDVINGGRGRDTIDGGDGVDTANYANSDLYVIVDLQAGTMIGSGHGGGDILINIENVYGSLYNDILTGDSGANELTGYSGNDQLNGGNGSDVLFGNAGTDTLNGGQDDDVMYGGAGADVFEFTDIAFGQDTIIGWQNGTDILDFTALGWSFSDFILSSVDDDTVLTLISDNSQTITLSGIAMSTIDAFDFV